MTHLLCAHNLVCELATDGTWDGVDALGGIHEVGVHIGEESLRVGLDLSNAEASTSVDVNTSGVVDDTSLEWTSQAADRHAVVLASDWLWVREGESWWASSATGSLVDVSGGVGWRLVLSADVVETDVVADGVELAVDTEVVEADGAWETTSWLVVHADNLAWNSLDAVGAGEWLQFVRTWQVGDHFDAWHSRLGIP